MMTTSTAPLITPTAIQAMLWDLAAKLVPDHGLNERYIHHAFTHVLQTQFPVLDLGKPHTELLLHPEWPTAKQSTGIAYAHYRNIDGHYQPVPLSAGRGAGFIDFAIGPYNAPEIGIEFSLKSDWNDEEVVYDFLKLLDPRTPFTAAFSQNIITRDNNLATRASRQDLEDHMNRALQEASNRLKPFGTATNRQLHFTVSEIATHERRHWHYDPAKNHFVEGPPR